MNLRYAEVLCDIQYYEINLCWQWNTDDVSYKVPACLKRNNYWYYLPLLVLLLRKKFNILECCRCIKCQFRAFRIVIFHASCSILRKKILKKLFLYDISSFAMYYVQDLCSHTKILHMVILLSQVCNFSVLLFFAILW